MRLALVLSSSLVSLAAQSPTQVQAPAFERQFDFWVGEWRVHNRSRTEHGFRDAGEAVARIRPILDGRAILEEWNGQSGDRAATYGISVRRYDPRLSRWVIVLNWPNPNKTSFGRMEGAFRHGRAEFFPPPAFAQKEPRATRFTFSDALPQTCRWDMAVPTAGGGWRTDWIMEFHRTRSAADTIADGEPVRRPPAKVSGAPSEARQFDPFVGVWRGTGRRDDATEAAVELRVSSTNRGLGTLCFLDVGDGDDVHRCFEAWAYQAKVGQWHARALDDDTPAFRSLVGGFDADGRGSFEQPGGADDERLRVSYALDDEGRLRLRREMSRDGGETFAVLLDATLERAAR